MRTRTWLVLVACLAIAAVAGVALGSVPVALADIWRALAGQGTGDALARTIVLDLRLPRVALGALVGAGLGMSGAALQGTLRNGLAEPYLLGVSGGAAVGAVLVVVVLGASGGTVPAAAFAGALVAVVTVLAVARAAGGRGDPRLLLMAGVVVGAFANAAIMIALANAPANTVRGATWWMMGSLADADWTQVGWLAAYVATGGAALVAMARQVDILALGAEAAASLGVEPDAASRRIFLAASLTCAATVAAAGLVGFVGLVVPHLARGAGGRGHRTVIVASALVGATLVIAADLGARVVLRPVELPLGAVTALVGVPFFLARLRRLA
ncbi:MAG: iron ABC transporter permease [Gemmatimonadetes bacterium]|nr:iron ABC transporter permease [Gemmatimonadota bacterium]